MAELKRGSVEISSPEAGFEVLVNVYYNDIDKLIIHGEDFSPDFFNLKTGFAGELLQKFSNYKMKLAIIGNFEDEKSKSLQDFIRECNRNKQIIFKPDVMESIQSLTH